MKRIYIRRPLTPPGGVEILCSGITYETMAPPFPLVVEFVELDVRQQRRERAALRVVLAGQQPSLEDRPILFQVVRQLVDRHAIGTRCALIADHAFIRTLVALARNAPCLAHPQKKNPDAQASGFFIHA